MPTPNVAEKEPYVTYLHVGTIPYTIPVYPFCVTWYLYYTIYLTRGKVNKVR